MAYYGIAFFVGAFVGGGLIAVAAWMLFELVARPGILDEWVDRHKHPEDE